MLLSCLESVGFPATFDHPITDIGSLLLDGQAIPDCAISWGTTWNLEKCWTSNEIEWFASWFCILVYYIYLSIYIYIYIINIIIYYIYILYIIQKGKNINLWVPGSYMFSPHCPLTGQFTQPRRLNILKGGITPLFSSTIFFLCKLPLFPQRKFASARCAQHSSTTNDFATGGVVPVLWSLALPVIELSFAGHGDCPRIIPAICQYVFCNNTFQIVLA